jgi:uncharacterized protein
MMLKKVSAILLIVFIGTLVLAFYSKSRDKTIPQVVNNIIKPTPSNPFQINYMREQNYPGSDLKIEQTLPDGSNYKRYIASYISEGLKIYGLLTIPNDAMPNGGFPAIIFNHGYITPEKYTADGNYIAYVNAFATRSYIVFKPDYRGNGKSEGTAGSTYFSRNYDIDDLNAISSIQKYSKVNSQKIGVWGHSMGGHITLMDLVISNNIKAAVIWGGVVGSYNDILYNWQNRVTYTPDAEDLRLRNQSSRDLLLKNGNPNENSEFWNSIDPTANLNFVNAPVQIHVGLADNQVPPDFSQSFYDKLKGLGKSSEIYTYPGADHNISQAFNLAMERSISFFDKYLK